MSEESFVLISYVNDGLVELGITFFQNFDGFAPLSSFEFFFKEPSASKFLILCMFFSPFLEACGIFISPSPTRPPLVLEFTMRSPGVGQLSSTGLGI